MKIESHELRDQMSILLSCRRRSGGPGNASVHIVSMGMFFVHYSGWLSCLSCG
jgi:hypothetical protein